MTSSNIQELNEHGKYLSAPSGNSMEPLLHDKKNAVEIVSAVHPLKKGDISLHIRDDGTSVLHRIIKVNEGSYLICGDNCVTPELVDADKVIGVATRFYRNGKWISVSDKRYLLYSRIWVGTFPIRRYLLKAYRICKAFRKRGDHK